MRAPFPPRASRKAGLRALLGVALVGCSSFDAAPPEDAGVDGGGLDATAGSDSSADGGSDDGAPCTGTTVLLGNDVVAANDDEAVAKTVDAYGYTLRANAAVEARCIRVYVASLADLGTGNLLLGVYAGTADPNARLSVATIVGPVAGWNQAVLDIPVRLEPAKTYWLALTPSQKTMIARSNSACAPGEQSRKSRFNVAAGELPLPFAPTGGGVECGASLYLTR